MATITPQDRAEILNHLIQKTSDHLFYLYDRWQDEKKYEDFEDYIKSIKEKFKAILPEAEVVSVTKKFHITLELPLFPYRPIVYVNSKSIGWKSS